MIGSITENLRKLAKQYSGREIQNEDGTHTQVADILLYAANYINDIQTADVTEVKRGVWILDDPKILVTHCSNCNWVNVHYAWSFCPNCGADMMEES